MKLVKMEAATTGAASVGRVSFATMIEAEAIAIAQDYVRKEACPVNIGEPKAQQMTTELLDEWFRETPPPSDAVRQLLRHQLLDRGQWRVYFPFTDDVRADGGVTIIVYEDTGEAEPFYSL